MFAKVYQLASSTAELLRDRELRHKAETLVSNEATKGVDNVQQGVSLRARNFGKGIRATVNGIGSGPRQIQNFLARLQTRIYEERLAALLQVARDAPVDVQIGPVLYEDAPQELRSRMWWALLEHPKLVSLLGTERALEARNSARSRAASSSGSSSPGSLAGSHRGSFSSPSSPTGPQSPSCVSASPGPNSTSKASKHGSSEPTRRHLAPQPLTDGPGVSTSRSNSLGFHGTKLRSRDVSPDRPHCSIPAESADSTADSRHSHAAAEKGSGRLAARDSYRLAAQSALTSPFEADQQAIGAKPAGSSKGQTAQDSDSTEILGVSAAADPVADTNATAADASDKPPADSSRLSKELLRPFERPAGKTALGSVAAEQGSLDGTDSVASGHSSKKGQEAPGSFSTIAEAESGEVHQEGSAVSEADKSSVGESESPNDGDASSQSGRAAAANGVGASEAASKAESAATSLQPQWAPVPAAAGLPSPSAPAVAHSSKAYSMNSLGEPELEDEWAMVEGAAQLYNFRDSRDLAAQLHPSRMDNFSEEGETLRQRVMDALVRVEWPLSAEYAEDSRYNTLLQISIGQEEVDEIITRDINRTFPEHPQFGFQQGQQALFRVLKAYSLHDLEVGYCQGMAFVAGLLLMYVPEEPAFRIACRLMSLKGPNLRILYLPGMEGLKAMLRMFEWLLHACHPQLKAHLQEHGAAPILYASQWFLTLFSCPFPAPFAARIIDILLIEHRPQILLRVAMAVMAQCEEALLKLHDFEDLITYLKVEPVRWPHATARKVINQAVEEAVSEALLQDAQRAIDHGFQGSISRATSSVREAAAAAAVAAADSVTLQRTKSAQGTASEFAAHPCSSSCDNAGTSSSTCAEAPPSGADRTQPAENGNSAAEPALISSSIPDWSTRRAESGGRESTFSFTSSDGNAAIEAERLAGDLALDMVWASPDDVPDGSPDCHSQQTTELDHTPSP
ncbi:hypothetical protein WJX74_010233 [Apatococcus lobatus]|uniref:Rab-GAP TBC domain-containing protein n=1 Tax=Apatococcus lobatus TaxID=904363 RepID=A0AAW1SAL8_9CHLO